MRTFITVTALDTQRAADSAPRALKALALAGFRVEQDREGAMYRATAWLGNGRHYEAQATGHTADEAAATLAWSLGVQLYPEVCERAEALAGSPEPFEGDRAEAAEALAEQFYGAAGAA